MPKWTDYTIKTEPADNDEVMVLDTAGKANKRLGLSALSDWIIGKIANKVFENLQTQNKTVLGAINELNSKSNVDTKAISYTDSEWNSLGGTDECVKDVVNKNQIPINGIFYKQLTAGARYLMLGYRYANGRYGTIILYKYDQTGDARYSISNGIFSKVVNSNISTTQKYF